LDQLPSGEKQIILLAGEIARRARPGMVCLIDEPELSLHPNLQHVLVGFLRSMAREFDMQFILATHSLEIIEALPATVRFLDGGSPMWQRAPERDAELLQAI
jgi:predicted ATP-dependent endonuclease of OLD family